MLGSTRRFLELLACATEAKPKVHLTCNSLRRQHSKQVHILFAWLCVRASVCVCVYACVCSVFPVVRCAVAAVFAASCRHWGPLSFFLLLCFFSSLFFFALACRPLPLCFACPLPSSSFPCPASFFLQKLMVAQSPVALVQELICIPHLVTGGKRRPVHPSATALVCILLNCMCAYVVVYTQAAKVF